MMRPAPRRRMWGTTARVIRTIPKKFVSKIDRACAIELSSAARGGDPKAGIVHEQVDLPFRGDHFADRGRDRFVARHVERQHLERSLACLGSSPAGAVDLVASLREPLGRGFADAR